MNTKKLISLLLCLVMVIGYAPVISTAAEEPASSSKVEFDELIDFECGTVGEQVDSDQLNAALKHPTLFKIGYSSAASASSEKHANRTYAKATDDGSIALKSYGGRGLLIEDTRLSLLNNNFVISFDMNVDDIADQHYTYVGWYVEGDTLPRASLVAINPTGYTDADGTVYPGSYTQGSGSTPSIITSPPGATTKMANDIWYHFDFYFNIEGKTVSAYKDGTLLYSKSISLPTNPNKSYLVFHSGATWKGTTIYYDNIHIKSLHDIDVSIDFESTGLENTADSLSAELNDEFVSIPHYISDLNALETSGTDTYMSIKVESHNLQTATYKCGNFFIEDKAMRLSYMPWVLSFDWRSAGTKKGETDVPFVSQTAGFLSFKPEPQDGGNKGNTISLLGVSSEGKLLLGSSTSTIEVKTNTWYRFNIVYDPSAHSAAIYMDGVKVGSTSINTENATANMFRFGYSWAGLYYKYNFDNISLKTYEPDAPLDIYIDFENGTAGESLVPADLSYGGLYTYAKPNGLSFNGAKAAMSANSYVQDTEDNMVLKLTNRNSFMDIVDASNRTLKEKFVVSFDIKFDSWRGDYTLVRWVYGSSNLGFLVLTGDGRLAVRAGLTGGYSAITPVLNIDQWYNVSAVVDPVNQAVTFYLDGLDTTPLYTTTCPDMSAYTYSAFSFGSGAYNAYLDNFRLYTVESEIEKAEYPDNFITDELPADKIFVNTDFEGFEASEITNESFNGVAPFKTSYANGIITEANGNKYFQSNGNGALSFNVSSTECKPIENGVIAIETDFTFGDNSANSGNLVIAAINRLNANGQFINAPLVTASKDGLVTVASQATTYTLPANETVRLRVELSYAFHTVNLYVNDSAVATGIPLMVALPITLISNSSFTDAAGITYQLPYTGSALDYVLNSDGTKATSTNGKYVYKVKDYENYKFAESVAYIKDTVDMFVGSASADAWSFAIDNLKIYMDDEADLLNVGFDGWTSTTVSSEASTVQNIYNNPGAHTNFIDSNGNMVASTAPRNNQGSLHFNEKLGYLKDKTFVFEYDLTFNEDFENISLNNTSVFAWTKSEWRHILRLNSEGELLNDATDTVFTTLTKDKWTKIQLLAICKSNGSHTGYLYIDGVKVATVNNMFNEMQLRIGNEGALEYDLKWDNVRIYLADQPDAIEPEITGTLDGNKLIQLEVSDTDSLNELMSNKTNGVTWNFKGFDTTAPDINDSTVNVLINKGNFVRVNHLSLKDASNYNITVQRAALEGHKQYVIETEIRYYCSTGFDLEVAKIFNAQTATYDKLLYIPGASREICFNRDGYAYSLKDASGNPLYAEEVTEDATEFTRLALIVDEEAGTYSIYVNGSVAYYDCDGTLITATEIAIDKIPVASTSIPESLMSTIIINNIAAKQSSTALLDIKSVNVYALRTGVAPYVMASQSKIEGDKYSVRFIAPIDMLYGKEVGFDVTTTQEGAKELTRASNLVYSSVNAYDEELEAERSFLAEEFGGTYLATISVNGIAIVDKVEITVKPFIVIGDSKIYNESFTVTYYDGKVVTE